MSKIIWDLSEADKDEIQALYEKKIALENLTKTVDMVNNEALYQKLIKDYGKTLIEFETWWSEISKKYQWEGSNWRIDFRNSQVVAE